MFAQEASTCLACLVVPFLPLSGWEDVLAVYLCSGPVSVRTEEQGRDSDR